MNDAAGDGLNLGKVIIEGKTKVVHELPAHPGQVLLVSKDRITAGDGARAHDLEGKAAISTATCAKIFEFLNSAGVKTHFIRQHGEKSFLARHCHMVPIEWVTRRVATGSFLRRHPGVKEGYRFCPPKQETFFKDDENHDPQWSYEQLIDAKLEIGGRVIGPDDVAIMEKTTLCVFEILEHAWASLNCSLIDMKVEFGIDVETGEIILGDIIDSDSWRLWPAGDKRLMKDKQVYRDLKTVTSEALDTVKRNFAWVAEQVKDLHPKPNARVVIVMGSPTDLPYGEKIGKVLKTLAIPFDIRVSSAHKGTDATLRILAEYEGLGVPTVFIAIAGRSNGLGPVLAGNSTWPVINAPPLTPEWAAEDVWSSLRLPSGIGCGTVITPDGAAVAAAQMLALSDHVVWSNLRAKQLNTWVGLKKADKDLTEKLQTVVANGVQ